MTYTDFIFVDLKEKFNLQFDDKNLFKKNKLLATL